MNSDQHITFYKYTPTLKLTDLHHIGTNKSTSL